MIILDRFWRFGRLKLLRGLRLVRMGGTTSKAMSSAETMKAIQQTVGTNCVVIYSKTTCSYCSMAKRVFQSIGEPFMVIELNKRGDGVEIQQALYELTGASTVPRVFINGKCIGGGTETRQLHKQGGLLPLLAQCKSCNSDPASGDQ